MKYFSGKQFSLRAVLLVAPLVVLIAAWALPVEEMSGKVTDVGSDYIVINDMRFSVDGDIEFEGYERLADVHVGDLAEVEYRTQGGANVALGIERGAEMVGTVEDVGSDYVVIDGSRFAVNSGTEFEEGYARLSDVQTGDRAEIEYEMQNGDTKVALGMEKGGDDGEDEGESDDDGDSR